MDIHRTAEEILKRSPYETEVYIARSDSLNIEVLDGKVKSIEKGSDAGIGVRILRDKRMGFAYSSFPDADMLISKAKENSGNMPEDDNNCFFSSNVPRQAMELDIFDEAIGSTNEKDKIKMALDIEAAARNRDPRITKTESAGYSDGQVEILVANSSGFCHSYTANECGGYAQVICEDKGEAEEGSALGAYRSWKEFDSAAIGREAADKALLLFGGKTIKSQKLPVVFDPSVAAEFLLAAASMLSAESAQKGRSAYAGKLGSAVAGTNISIVDDGTLKRGLISSPFDAEGAPRRRNILISSGILNSFMHNCYTASKDETVTTGNASRASFKTTPSVRPSNLFIVPGKKGHRDILSSAGISLLITRVMAMHSVNPVSGDFSVGAAGCMIENGKPSDPVRGITIAGNLIELLSGVEEIGSDLKFFPEASGCGSPTLLISSLSVGGE